MLQPHLPVPEFEMAPGELERAFFFWAGTGPGFLWVTGAWWGNASAHPLRLSRSPGVFAGSCSLPFLTAQKATGHVQSSRHFTGRDPGRLSFLSGKMGRNLGLNTNETKGLTYLHFSSTYVDGEPVVPV